MRETLGNKHQPEAPESWELLAQRTGPHSPPVAPSCGMWPVQRRGRALDCDPQGQMSRLILNQSETCEGRFRSENTQVCHASLLPAYTHPQGAVLCAASCFRSQVWCPGVPGRRDPSQESPAEAAWSRPAPAPSQPWEQEPPGLTAPYVLQLLLQFLGELLEGRPLPWLYLPAALHQGVEGRRAFLRGLHAIPLLHQLRHFLQGLGGERERDRLGNPWLPFCILTPGSTLSPPGAALHPAPCPRHLCPHGLSCPRATVTPCEMAAPCTCTPH